MNLTQIIQILREIQKKWYLFLIIPFLAAVAIFFLTRNRPLEYISQATVYLHLPTQKGLSLTNEEYKQFEIATYFQNIIEMSRSRKNLERIRMTILHDVLTGKSNWIPVKNEFPFTDSTKVRQRLEVLLKSYDNLNLRREQDAGITIFMENNGLSVQQMAELFTLSKQGNSNYIQITTKHSNPFLAAYFNELVINNLLEIHRELNKGRLQADRSLFEKLVQEAKDHLDERISVLENYKIKNKIINLDEHTKAIVNQLVNLEMQYASLVETIQSRKKGLTSIKDALGDTSSIPVNVETNSRYIEMKKQIQSLQQNQGTDESVTQLSNMVKQFVKDVPIDIRSTKQELIQQYVAYKIEIEMTTQLLPLVKAELARMNSYAAKFAPFESNIGTMEREIQTAQESYLILLNKLNMAKTVEAGTGENELVIIDAPTIPIKPSSTKRKLLVIAAAVVMFLLIAVVIIVLELLDRGLWNIQITENALKVPVLAGIPSIQEIITTQDHTLEKSLTLIREQQFNAIAYYLNKNQEVVKNVAILSAFENEGRHELAYQLKNRFKLEGKTIQIHDIERNSASNFAYFEKQEESNEAFEINILPPASIYTDWQNYTDKADLFIYVIRAGRTAEFIDRQIIKEIGSDKMKIVLNALPSSKSDDLGLSIQKNRSSLRRWLKKVMHLQFGKRNSELYV